MLTLQEAFAKIINQRMLCKRSRERQSRVSTAQFPLSHLARSCTHLALDEPCLETNHFMGLNKVDPPLESALEPPSD